MCPHGKPQAVFNKRGITVNKRFWLPAILISSLMAATPFAGPAAAEEQPITQAAAAAVTIGDPVSEVQFAWLLFVYAAQPANGSLMFETWTEQCQLNPAMLGCPPPGAAAAVAGKAHNFHGSALLQALRKKRGIRAAAPAAVQPGIECKKRCSSTAPSATSSGKTD